MKALNNEIDIYFQHSKQSWGKYLIFATIKYKGQTEQFEAVSHDSDFFDELNDKIFNQSKFDEIQQLYYDKFFSYFEVKIIDFCYQIDIEQ